MTGFPDPPDHPDTAAAARQCTGRAAAALQEGRQAALRTASGVPDAWQGSDADAAVDCLTTLARRLQDCADVLRPVTRALEHYRSVLEGAQAVAVHTRADAAGIRQACELRAAQELTPEMPPEMRQGRIASIHADARAELAAVQDRYDAADTDVHTAARRLAGVLGEAGTALRGNKSATRLGVMQHFATLLPFWGADPARQAADEAAAALDLNELPLTERAVLEKYAGWADVSEFATRFLQDVGPAGFSRLLAGGYPGLYDPAVDAALIKAVYGVLGRILAAGTRTDPDRRWLRGLDYADERVRAGLGIALRHGRYGVGALEVLVPPLLRHPGDFGISPYHPAFDPLVGAMSALTRTPQAASRILARGDRLRLLLHRPWPEDDGTSLGEAIAATVRAHPPDALLRSLVEAVGDDADAVPAGVGPGIGRLLAANMPDVNGSLSTDVRLPDAGTTMRLDPRQLARALFVALRTHGGTVAVFAGQAGYAARMISTAPQRLNATLDALSGNYGRLAGIHQRSIADLAARGDAADADSNAETLVRMGSFLVGMVPLPTPVAGPLLGLAEGQALGKITQVLEHEFAEPRLRRQQARHASAERHIARVLRNSNEYTVRLVAAAYPRGAPALPRGLSVQQVCTQAARAGQNDVTTRLLPDRPLR